MTNYDTRKIEHSLKKKGFQVVPGRSGHKFLYLYINGKKTSVFTFLSHGTKDYDDGLLAIMKKQLGLNNKQELCQLIECPMTRESYFQILVNKGIINQSIVPRPLTSLSL